MKIFVTTLALAVAVAACSFRSERTVQTAPPAATTTVTTPAPPATTTTVYTR
ncbi:MAG: hypothetical protein K2X72_12010 [Reyranella sp.]|nr:hypothetical protein [Reyranella sp.]